MYIYGIYAISIFIKITPQCANVADERTHENCIVNLIYLQAASASTAAAVAVALLWLLHPRHVLNERHRISRQ